MSNESSGPNIYKSSEYLATPYIADTGFREYDVRWRVIPEAGTLSVGINYRGLQQVGLALAAQLRQNSSRIVVGHDYRSYSPHVKNALVVGLMTGGLDVVDIGMVPSPAAYFAQYHLDVDSVAMVTASHNSNGWSGIKMGAKKGITFGPEEVALLKGAVGDASLAANVPSSRTGGYAYEPSILEAYAEDLVSTWHPLVADHPSLRVAVETGNGTAGPYLVKVLSALGYDVVEGNTGLDWDFPNYNPDPESIPFLKAVGELVTATGADVGICVDGDGDRLGVVDEEGQLLFSDRIGLLIARHIERTSKEATRFVVDVKSTSLFNSVLNSPVDWCKTGHSYVKAAVRQYKATAGFERSGHFFLAPPYGRAYDDAAAAALAFLWVLGSARADDPSASVSQLNASLPKTFQSPNRQPHVADEDKYRVVDAIAEKLAVKESFAGQKVVDTLKINGIRLTLEDGSWLLVRASSNSPNLVIVAESQSDSDLLKEIDLTLRLELDQLHLPIGDFDPLHEH